LGLGIHHPDGRVSHIGDLAPGTIHQPGKDRGLVRHEEGGESDGEDQAQVLGAVSGKHLPGNEVHHQTPL
jgi:hypothetical protein